MVSYDDPFHIGLTGRQITTLGTSLVLVTLLVTFVLVVLISRVTRRFDPNSTSSPRLASLLIGLGIGFTYGAQAAADADPEGIPHAVATSLDVLAAACIVLGAWRLVPILVTLSHTSDDSDGFTAALRPHVARICKVLVAVGGALMLSRAFGLDVTALVAGLGIGGIALALAAQDSIANLFGSVTLALDRPFRHGDYIVAGDISGTVEEIGFRSTRIRTSAGTMVTYPNMALASTPIENFGEREARRVRTHLQLAPSVTANEAESVIESWQEACDNAPDVLDGALCRLERRDPGGWHVLLNLFLDVSTWDEELEGRQRLILELVAIAEAHGIALADVQRHPVT